MIPKDNESASESKSDPGSVKMPKNDSKAPVVSFSVFAWCCFPYFHSSWVLAIFGGWNESYEFQSERSDSRMCIAELGFGDESEFWSVEFAELDRRITSTSRLSVAEKKSKIIDFGKWQRISENFFDLWIGPPETDFNFKRLLGAELRATVMIIVCGKFMKKHNDIRGPRASLDDSNA